MIILSWALDLQAKGVAVLGPVPGGLPHFGLPQVSLSVVPQLLATAFSMFIVIIAQSAATSRAYAAKYDERFSENTDLVGLTLANIGAGLSGTFVVNGSPTKTQMVDGAGGTQPARPDHHDRHRLAGAALSDRPAGVLCRMPCSPQSSS